MRKWLLLAVVVAGCASDQPAPLTAKQVLAATTTATTTLAPTTTVPPATTREAPLVLQGDGNLNTPPFRLNGGTYRSRWQTFGDCTYYGHLEPMNDYVVNASTATTGETYVYNVKAGEYHVSMNTGSAPRCRWQITLERI